LNIGGFHDDTGILATSAEIFCYSFMLISQLFRTHNVVKSNNKTNKTTSQMAEIQRSQGRKVR
jgi:hypothetical protein|tara:strand:+ start:167 stop:355 length:189 start_codon:yes stop_codon:yes gene_type:complete